MAAILELGCEPLEPLGRDVEQPEGALGEPAADGFPLRVSCRAVQRGRRDAPGGRGRDLILHERDERGDDECEPARDQRRHLEADRFPAPGGQHRQRVPPGEHRGDDRPLGGPELAVTEVVAQEAAGLVHGPGHGAPRCSVASRLLHPGAAARIPDTQRPPRGGEAAGPSYPLIDGDGRLPSDSLATTGYRRRTGGWQPSPPVPGHSSPVRSRQSPVGCSR